MGKQNTTFKAWADKGWAEVNGQLVDIKATNTQEKKEKIQKLPNAKVKNATKIEIDGVKFDSLLESYMYGLLKGAKINFEFQKVYLLQEKFRYNGEAIRAITLTVDFLLPDKNILVDTKGFQTQQGTMRWKMLKRVLLEDYIKMPSIEMPKNKKECDLLLNRILYDK